MATTRASPCCTPDGKGRFELLGYSRPDAIETNPPPHEIGKHRVAFPVDDIDKALEIAAAYGLHPLRGVATYPALHKLTHVRSPSGTVAVLAEELKTH